jgi:hypothetical protein
MDIDGSFELTVERTAWGDVSLLLRRHDLRIDLDPADAVRVCEDIWAALGRDQSGHSSRVA